MRGRCDLQALRMRSIMPRRSRSGAHLARKNPIKTAPWLVVAIPVSALPGNRLSNLIGCGCISRLDLDTARRRRLQSLTRQGVSRAIRGREFFGKTLPCTSLRKRQYSRQAPLESDRDFISSRPPVTHGRHTSRLRTLQSWSRISAGAPTLPLGFTMKWSTSEESARPKL